MILANWVPSVGIGEIVGGDQLPQLHLKLTKQRIRVLRHVGSDGAKQPRHRNFTHDGKTLNHLLGLPHIRPAQQSRGKRNDSSILVNGNSASTRTAESCQLKV